MYFAGETLIPPSCPAVLGRTEDRVDIATAVIGLAIFIGKQAEICLDYKRQLEDEEALIEVRAIIEPHNSDIANRASRLAEEMDHGDFTRSKKLEKILCDRVANCHGVVNGECWALGPKALREVITQVTDDPA